MTDALLRIEGVTKRFGGVLAVDEVSLAVPEGGIAGLIGPNGSGKTTLFGLISGHLRPDRGRLVFAGSDLDHLDEAAVCRRGLLRTFQQPQVFGSLTCRENMRISTPMRCGLFDSARSDVSGAADWLDFVGLSSHAARPAGTLSFGQRKILELAMALARRPRMILLDEPAAGVSPALAAHIGDLLRDLNHRFGITFLIIEHDLAFLARLAEQVHCLANGRLVASGSPEAIRADARVRDAYLGRAA